MTDKTDPCIEAMASNLYDSRIPLSYNDTIILAEIALTALDAYHAANGLVVVPREVTEAMERAGLAVDNATVNHAEIYAAMIAASAPDSAPPATADSP